MLGIIALSGMVFFQSCNNEDDNNDPAPTQSKEDLLVDQDWQISKFVIGFRTDNATINLTLGSLGLSSLDAVEEFEECEKDDLIDFKADKTFATDDYKLTCPDYVEESGTWSESNDFATLSMEFNEAVLTFDGIEIFLGDADIDALVASAFKNMTVDKFTDTEVETSNEATVTSNVSGVGEVQLTFEIDLGMKKVE